MVKSISRPIMVAVAAAVAFTGMASPAYAQRDPAYDAARAAGTIGEKIDGYLGVVGSGDATLRKLVDDLNIKRRETYAERARAQGSTVEQYAFTTGCLLIARTKAGEKYQAPDGSWQTRGAGAPQRDSRCP